MAPLGNDEYAESIIPIPNGVLVAFETIYLKEDTGVGGQYLDLSSETSFCYELSLHWFIT